MRYVSFIHREQAGYGVSFPDFPGCVSVGNTVDAPFATAAKPWLSTSTASWTTGRRFPRHARSTPSRPTRHSRTGGSGLI